MTLLTLWAGVTGEEQEPPATPTLLQRTLVGVGLALALLVGVG